MHRYINKTALFGALLCLTASSIGAQERPRGNRPPAARGQSIPSSSPSVIVAAESRFERMAREEGQWTAFRENATEDAFSFTPNLQSVEEWLDRRNDPKQADSWDPYHIIMSCDGSMAASRGAWQSADGTKGGYYTAIWQRQKKGDYKWVFDHASDEAPADGDPSAVTSQRGDCQRPPRLSRAEQTAEAQQQAQDEAAPLERRRRNKKAKKPKRPDRLASIISLQGERKQVSGRSNDRSLLWEAVQWPDGRRTLKVSILQDGEYIDVITDELSAVNAAAKDSE